MVVVPLLEMDMIPTMLMNEVEDSPQPGGKLTALVSSAFGLEPAVFRVHSVMRTTPPCCEVL